MRNAILFFLALATVGVMAQSTEVHPLLQPLSQYMDVSKIEPLRAKAAVLLEPLTDKAELFINTAKADGALVAAQAYPETAIVFFSAFFIVLGFIGTFLGCVVPANKESDEDIELKKAAAVPVPAMKSSSAVPLKKRK
ncbi:hypothetical protein HMN09_00901400 [Mycena chlorophos]|uniref:Uncharacterized protein n=2 Tax=Mycena chlorophos TaxID=658473 RepID=A0A146IJT1_MYCCL|nr:hypothetical protein HMN09_00901400 [Mycena chlorophos]GAT59807.1 predicted protein [Mycena chlorophos]